MSDLMDIARAARKVSDVTAEEMFELLLESVKHQTKHIEWLSRQLPRMPGSLSISELMKIYSDDVMKRAEELTEEDKQQAILNVVLEQDNGMVDG